MSIRITSTSKRSIYSFTVWPLSPFAMIASILVLSIIFLWVLDFVDYLTGDWIFTKLFGPVAGI